MAPHPFQPPVEQVWSWLAEVEDPEIPVISIVDLGIVREVRWQGEGDAVECVVTVTPTYSGCPATHVIARSVVDALHERGIERVRLDTRIAPPWTTDWMSDAGKRKLREYGIAPPEGPAPVQAIAIGDIGRGPRPSAPLLTPRCPRCDAAEVTRISQFGSTPCKALYRCDRCLEPFDHFKCH